ncbi:unnamed protein product [Arabidopsis lyrata]|uniref:Predicted protein n=2 Tax=Arabidopsis TaxID=3701 RepID=D7LHJ7_ARALL|nr:predicted protein [Arabidopsis lyrata subsp. lyrata]CAH8263348.1 unnamed protein product [Arabidopsis lyrata]
MDNNGDSSEETLSLMYDFAGAIFLYLVALGIFGFCLFRQWLAFAKPSYTSLVTDEQIQDEESNIINRV